jgi:hypothetical protein
MDKVPFTLEQLEQIQQFMQNNEANKSECTSNKDLINEIFGDTSTETQMSNKQSRRDRSSKVASYRKQVEYGPKKFIKP